MSAFRVIMAAGGTGGHLWPAISLARAIKKKVPDADFLFVGTGRPIEEKMLAPEGFRRVVVTASGLKGQGLVGGVKSLIYCLTSVFSARAIINEFKPDLCFGAGGYVTVPVGIAARLCGIPLLIHEQNSRPGLSNKILSRLAEKTMLGFKSAASAFPPGKTVFTGNPVRREIIDIGGKKMIHQPPVISVTGGSQGAWGLNKLIVPALIKLKHSGTEFHLFHQSGAGDLDWVTRAYEEAGLKAEVRDFYHDMVSFYARSDIVIARAGAITIAELAAAGMPSVLIPLPTAADDHQSINARWMEENGAALLRTEKNTTPEELAASLAQLLGNKTALENMAISALALAKPGADEAMARVCLDIVGKA